MSYIADLIFGPEDQTTTTVLNVPPMSEEEKELIALTKQLAERQLKSIDELAPFQRKLLEQQSAYFDQQAAIGKQQSEAIQFALEDEKARRAAMSPEELATLQREEAERGRTYLDLAQKSLENETNTAKIQTDIMLQEAERAKKLGPIQDELLSMQVEQLRRNGAATPEQIQQIREATEAGIAAGSGDIDIATKRGIGLVEDELANSRGLRLTDSPIRSEADLVSRAGVDQKASLIKNLRASEATARLNYPLAAQQLQSGINLNQQSVNQAATQFQADLRQRAQMNRLALTGQTMQGGLGLASIGGNTGGALRVLGQDRFANSTQTTTGPGRGTSLGDVGTLAYGSAALYKALGFSDRRLKLDLGVVGETRGGLPLHLYKYRGEPKDAPLRLGLMADEVQKKKPEAVRRHSSGFAVVDYVSALGLEG